MNSAYKAIVQDNRDRFAQQHPRLSAALNNPITQFALAAAGGGIGVAPTVAVVHFTSVEGAAAIEGSGGLRAGSFVALPTEVAGRSASQVEQLLEISPGRGAMSATIRVPADALRTPANGPATSGGATQYQLTRPIPVAPKTFTPTP